MKRFLLFVSIVFHCTIYAQNNKWFISAGQGLTISGPGRSIKQQMVRQGFNDVSSFNFFGIAGSTQYPLHFHEGNLIIRGGYKLNEKKSLYLVAGLLDKGSVSGFRNQGYSNMVLIAASYGISPKFNYSYFQFGGGFMFSRNIRTKLGVGPSLYGLKFKYDMHPSHFKVLPGINLCSRIPLGREKRMVGLELYADINLVPPLNIGLDESSPGHFQPGKVNMVQANLGWALSFRRGMPKTSN